MGRPIRSASACLRAGRRGEGSIEGEAHGRPETSADALPHRSGCVTQGTNMRATAKQTPGDRMTRQMAASLSSQFSH